MNALQRYVRHAEENLFFSEKSMLEKLIFKWMAEYRCVNSPFSTISFLQINGLIHIDKAKEFIKKEQDKI